MHTICYARISTTNPEQYVSLNNQIRIIKKFVTDNNIKNTVNIVESISISNGLSKKMREEFIKYKKVNVIVTSVDRLTRNPSDSFLIKKHIENIYVINDKKIYNTKRDLKDIILCNIAAMEEIEKIKGRLGSNQNKRKSNEEESDLACRKRCNNIYNIVTEKYDDTFIDDIVDFTRRSQNLKSIEDWRYISSIYKKYSRTGLLDDYSIADFTQEYYIMRSDLYEYIINIFKNRYKVENFDILEPFLREFINANINFSKKNINYKNTGNINNIEKLTEKMKQLNKLGKLEDSDINKISNLVAKISKK